MSFRALSGLLIACLLVVAIVYQLLTRQPSTRTIAPTAGDNRLRTEQPTPPAAGANAAPQRGTVPKPAIPESGWGRNPFLTSDEIREMNTPAVPIAKAVPAAPPEPEVSLPAYTVTAILYGTEGNRAILDKQIVRIGDTVGQETVKEIKPGIVVLEYGGRTRELALRKFEDAVRRVAPKGEKP